MARSDGRLTKYYYLKERTKRLIIELSMWQTCKELYPVISEQLNLKPDLDGIIIVLGKQCKELITELNQIKAAAKGLSQRDIFIFELRYLDGRSWQDIMVLTSLSEQRLMEINKHIRDQFSAQGKLYLLEDGD